MANRIKASAPTADDAVAQEAITTPVAEPPAPEQAYNVSLRMQVGSTFGDNEYHVRMTRREIEGLLRGTVTCVRLPERYGASRNLRNQTHDEWRFLPLSNIVEITLENLEWPAADYIAETVE